jgi:amino acid transporter
MSVLEVLLGKRLRTDEQEQQRIGATRGIGILGLDALSSAAYGPEAALTVLLAVGATATRYIGPISAVIIAVFIAVYLSYRQTIEAYPNGGGSYTVASQNLGRYPGLLAAAALSLDYILNVAVGISAGVGAVVSAAPALLPYTLPLCLAILVLLTLINLRGIRETGLVFLFPTYLFVGSLGFVIIFGILRSVLAHGNPAAVVHPPAPIPATAAVSAWLLLRAFASGTTAMTGVEAVSNGVPLFHEPATRTANRTLTAIVVILVAMLIGIAYLCQPFGITATVPGAAGYQSVLSQLTGAVVGRGTAYYITMASVVTVLCLSANTSFADFPRLCRLLAIDRFLPIQLAHPGRRLVYTAGILALAVCAGTLITIFGGITDRLIPLFAVGALLAFTLSQWGMVAHWRRVGGPHAGWSLLLNGGGAIATTLTVLVVVVAKFTEGAWITVLVIPLFVMFFMLSRHSADRIDRAIMAEGTESAPLSLDGNQPPIVILPMRRLDRVARKGLRFALSVSPDVQVVLVVTDDPTADEKCAISMKQSWEVLVNQPARAAGHGPVDFVTLPSEYREFFTPFLKHVRGTCQTHPGRYVAVVIPEVVERRWYDLIFASHRPALLKAALRAWGGPQVLVVDAPWHIGDPDIG